MRHTIYILSRSGIVFKINKKKKQKPPPQRPELKKLAYEESNRASSESWAKAQSKGGYKKTAIKTQELVAAYRQASFS